VEHGDLAAGLPEQRVQIPSARAVQAIHHDTQARPADRLEIYQASQTLNVGRPWVDPLDQAGKLAPLSCSCDTRLVVRIALARPSICLVASGSAGPPHAAENLMPLYSGGL